MALKKTDALFAFGVALVFKLNVVQGAIVGISQSDTRLTRATRSLSSGICNLEIRTDDLLGKEDMPDTTPENHGSKFGFSRIQVCCSGWRRKAHSAYECEPACHNGCPNGNCTSPNVCICLPGYIRDLDNNCVPTCPRGCPNGECTLQDQCSCTAGYRLDPKGQFCIPHCTGGCGIGGNCTAPELCSCNFGFETDPASGKCRHHCEGGCPGGECIGLNQCTSTPGHVRKNKVCDLECRKRCFKGVCTRSTICSCKPHRSDSCLDGNCTVVAFLKIIAKGGK